MHPKKFSIGILLFLSLVILAGTSFAVTYPLNQPGGLALDAKGNLYVANNVASQILVYSPGYVQLTKKTITTNVLYPVGVAIDVGGNIWVVNAGFNNNPGSVSEYTAAGTPITTITSGIHYPQAIAADAVGNVWVLGSNTTLLAFPISGDPVPFRSYALGSITTGLATHNQWLAFTGAASTDIQEIGPFLGGASFIHYTVPTVAFTAAYDAAGNLYSAVGGSTNSINVTDAKTNITSQLIALPYFPFGIVVDSVRGRIYVSDALGSQINVYNMQGALLKTLQ